MDQQQPSTSSATKIKEKCDLKKLNTNFDSDDENYSSAIQSPIILEEQSLSYKAKNSTNDETEFEYVQPEETSDPKKSIIQLLFILYKRDVLKMLAKNEKKKKEDISIDQMDDSYMQQEFGDSYADALEYLTQKDTDDKKTEEPHYIKIHNVDDQKSIIVSLADFKHDFDSIFDYVQLSPDHYEIQQNKQWSRLFYETLSERPNVANLYMKMGAEKIPFHDYLQWSTGRITMSSLKAMLKYQDYYNEVHDDWKSLYQYSVQNPDGPQEPLVTEIIEVDFSRDDVSDNGYSLISKPTPLTGHITQALLTVHHPLSQTILDKMSSHVLSDNEVFSNLRSSDKNMKSVHLNPRNIYSKREPVISESYSAETPLDRFQR